jgi:hypothetical protein
MRKETDDFDIADVCNEIVKLIHRIYMAILLSRMKKKSNGIGKKLKQEGRKSVLEGVLKACRLL